MKRNKLFSTAGFVSIFIPYSPAIAQVSPATVIPQLGTVQQQDLESAKRLEQEKRGYRDYQNRQLKEGPMVHKQVKKREKATERAKPSEYKTKGVYIEKIDIPNSQILTKEEIADIVKDYEQTNLTMEDIKELVERINDLYLDKGFVTARAYLPEQTIENGLLKIAVMEGKVGYITVEGNRWTKTSHIRNGLWCTFTT